MADDASDPWVFGYGSLVWRPAFEHLERAPGAIRHFARRFWQGSPDHRGEPHAPGRVVTLVPEPGAVCWGMGYRVSRRVFEEVVVALDERESGGFERLEVELRFADAGRRPTPALVYVAPEGNPNFLGPASHDEMVAQVVSARGKSGANTEYVLRLAESLRALDVEDDHVFRLADAVAAHLSGRAG
ncbi:MAG: gamma-glutamylcyclotransferase [Myxococcota bacterium]